MGILDDARPKARDLGKAILLDKSIHADDECSIFVLQFQIILGRTRRILWTMKAESSHWTSSGLPYRHRHRHPPTSSKKVFLLPIRNLTYEIAIYYFSDFFAGKPSKGA